jgi:hypothetical protein
MVGGSLRLLPTGRIDIAESGVKHQKSNQIWYIDIPNMFFLKPIKYRQHTLVLILFVKMNASF